jgi:hypothetical protein
MMRWTGAGSAILFAPGAETPAFSSAEKTTSPTETPSASQTSADRNLPMISSGE